MANIGFVKQILKFELYLFSKFNSGAAEKLPVHVSFRRACTVHKSCLKLTLKGPALIMGRLPHPLPPPLPTPDVGQPYWYTFHMVPYPNMNIWLVSILNLCTVKVSSLGCFENSVGSTENVTKILRDHFFGTPWRRRFDPGPFEPGPFDM